MIFRARVEDLRLPANVAGGCNFLVIASLAHLLRSTTDDPPPVQVRCATGGWRVVDGRHRLLAAVIAGRPDVLCEEVP